jgi:hemoglobin/transferrin/lactoferrin receptor protein
LNAQYNSWKRIETYRLNAEDNETYATTEGTPAFVIFNARWSQTISEKLSLNMGIENILNTQYRSFASGINGPGRNLFIAVRLNS